jgi:alginate O-acetyltransferase complex protein AlgI
MAWAYALLVVMLGWVLFRAPSLHATAEVWRGMFGLNGTVAALGPELARAWTPSLMGLMAIGFWLSIFSLRTVRRLWPARAPRLGGLLDGAAVCALLALSILAVAGGGYSPFLYYRF